MAPWARAAASCCGSLSRVTGEPFQSTRLRARRALRDRAADLPRDRGDRALLPGGDHHRCHESRAGRSRRPRPPIPASLTPRSCRPAAHVAVAVLRRVVAQADRPNRLVWRCRGGGRFRAPVRALLARSKRGRSVAPKWFCHKSLWAPFCARSTVARSGVQRCRSGSCPVSRPNCAISRGCRAAGKARVSTPRSSESALIRNLLINSHLRRFCCFRETHWTASRVRDKNPTRSTSSCGLGQKHHHT
jgi:hypothetical protein